MKPIMQLLTSKTPALSLKKIRVLIYLFSFLSTLLLLFLYGMYVRQEVQQKIYEYEKEFTSQAESIKAKIQLREELVTDISTTLIRLDSMDSHSMTSLFNTENLVSKLTQRGDRSYTPLAVCFNNEGINPTSPLYKLIDLLTFTLRTNGQRYRLIQNIYLIDSTNNQFYWIPVQNRKANEILQNNTLRKNFINHILGRFRNNKILSELYETPNKVIPLKIEPSPLSNTKTITFATAINSDDEPIAILGIDFPVAPLFEDPLIQEGYFSIAFEDNTAYSFKGEQSTPVTPIAPSARSHKNQTKNTPDHQFNKSIYNGVLLRKKLNTWGWEAIYLVSLKEIWTAIKGEVIWLLFATLSVGMIIFFWALFIDRRILKPAHEHAQLLHSAEALNRAVIQTAPVGLALISSNPRKIIQANNLAYKMMEGTSQSERRKLLKSFLKKLESRLYLDTVGSDTLTQEILLKDGSKRHLEITLTKIKNDGIITFLCTLSNITLIKANEALLKEAIAQADSANEAKSLFLAVMSHEIRTPLNGMLGGIELLGMTKLEKNQRMQLSIIQQSSKLLNRLINDVLDFSKIEAGQMNLLFNWSNPSEMIESVLRSFAPQASGKGVLLFCLIDPAVPENIWLDISRVEQILNNLISNAIKFTDIGKIIVSLTWSSHQYSRGHLILKVSDTGIGIPLHDQQFLFQSFAQASNNQLQIGTGLGLSICKKLVSLMHGELQLVSDVGLGTSISIKIPCNIEPNTNPSKPLIAGLTIGIAITQIRELQQNLKKWLEWNNAKVVLLNTEEAIPQGLDVLMSDDDNLAEQLAVDVILSQDAPLIPDMSLVPIKASPFCRKSIMMALAAAAGIEVDDNALEKLDSLSQASPNVVSILVVEDHFVNRQVIKQQLEILGQHAIIAKDGEEALALLPSSQFDLIITDLQMPGLDGYALARTLRNQGVLTTIVATSANIGMNEEAMCKAAGIDRYLAKPIGLETLKSLLIELFGEIAPLPNGPTKTNNVNLMIISALENDLSILDETFSSRDLPAFISRLHSITGAISTLGYSEESELAFLLLKKLKTGEAEKSLEAHWPLLKTKINNLIQTLYSPYQQQI